MRGLLAGSACAVVMAAPARADVDVIAQAAPGITLSEARAEARAAGLTPLGSLHSIRAFRAVGTGAELRRLRRTGRIGRVERAPSFRLSTDTSHKATRGLELLAGSPALDGRGVGIGIVDTGVDGTHPDLAGKVPTNLRMVDDHAVPLENSDQTGGHGTHVAGIAAGTGAASSGRFRGAAPAATLHAFSQGIGPTHLINPYWAWDWILRHNHELSPPIRVVNNSFDGATETEGYDPDYFQFQLIDKLIASGVTMVFAAGNSGGDGSARATSKLCLDPTPGAVCVANYDDDDSGTFGGNVNESSSRGQRGSPQSYPDLMAPGTNITAPCRPSLPGCLLGRLEAGSPLEYAVKSGTSMAAPHVAGIVAQLIQARPDLTPAQVETVLVETARPVATGAAYEPDPGRPGMTSFDKGHGLVDAKAAVERLLALPAAVATPPPAVVAAPPPAVQAPASPAPPQLLVRRRGRRLAVRISSSFRRVPVRVRRGPRVVARGTWRGGELVLRVPRRGRLRVEARFGRHIVRASA